MYRELGQGRLSGGEPLEVGVVEAPDADWAARIGRFLAHKGGDWTYHIELALRQDLDALRTSFYVASVAGELISQVMISAARGAGILGHVFTAPAWRRRGAYRQLMAAQMADVARQGLQVLTLGTGYDSHPYWIYHSFGFRPVAPESGLMCWQAAPDAVDRYLAPAAAEARTLGWGDWPGFNLLALQPPSPDEPLPRLPALGLKGQQSAEGPFLTFMRRCRGLPEGQRRVLQSPSGAVVGWCLLAPDPRWFSDVWLLDLGLLPDFAARRAELTRDLAWPEAPVYAVHTPDGDRDAWLASLGLRPLATLPRWLLADGERRDVALRLRD